MNAAEITAICTGAPAVLGAVTALVIALRSSRTARAAAAALEAHGISAHASRPR